MQDPVGRNTIRELKDGYIYVLPEPHTPRQVTHTVDDRWLVAFACAVGDPRPAYLDVEAAGGVVAHPVFAACLEWPLVANGAPGIALNKRTLNRGLHVRQTSVVHEPITAGQQLTTTAELWIAEQRSKAVHVATQFTTRDDMQSIVVVTRTHMLYPGVRLVGDEKKRTPELVERPTNPDLEVVSKFEVDVTNAAIYSECSRIWNPIHTDPRVAKAAGLPGPVLHGTETLARAVSLVTAQAPGGPSEVELISCDFTAPVVPGSRLTIRASDKDDNRRIAFDVLREDGHPVISDGTIVLPQVAAAPLAESKA